MGRPRRMAKVLSLLCAVALLAAALAVPAVSAGAPGGPSAHAAKKCKKRHGHKRKCRKKLPPNPYVAGQPCDPALAQAYARYNFLCLPQPQPDGTTQNQLVPALA
jgi:hypothetical protein